MTNKPVKLPEAGQWPDKVAPWALLAGIVLSTLGFLMAFLYAGPVNGAAVDGEGAADADGSAASTAGEAPSGTEPSASEGAAAPAPAPAPEPAPAPSAPSTVTVSVYIDSSRAASNGYPSSLGGGTVTLNQGASVYDALCATGASVGGSSGYVSSIGGLAEFACGPGSGWLYFVNGSSPGYGCGSYILSGGENITWIYTCDLGNDL